MFFPKSTGFFVYALPATFARRTSLRLRMTSDFDAQARALSKLAKADAGHALFPYDRAKPPLNRVAA